MNNIFQNIPKSTSESYMDWENDANCHQIKCGKHPAYM